MNKRTVQPMRGLLETAAGWHDTLLYSEEQDAAPNMSADIRVLRGALDTMRTEVRAAASVFPDATR